MTNKLKHKIINYLNKEYSGLIRYETDRWEDLIFYMKDDKFIFEYNKKNGYTFISYGIIWSFLETYFGLEYKEIQDITKEWVEEQFKSEVTTTEFIWGFRYFRVEEQFKSEVTTTEVLNRINSRKVEEQFKSEVTTTGYASLSYNHSVEEQFKSEVTTTSNSFFNRLVWVEEQFKSEVTTTHWTNGRTFIW